MVCGPNLPGLFAFRDRTTNMDFSFILASLVVFAGFIVILLVAGAGFALYVALQQITEYQQHLNNEREARWKEWASQQARASALETANAEQTRQIDYLVARLMQRSRLDQSEPTRYADRSSVVSSPQRRVARHGKDRWVEEAPPTSNDDLFDDERDTVQEPWRVQ